MGTVIIDPRNDRTPVTDAVFDHVAHTLSAAREIAKADRPRSIEIACRAGVALNTGGVRIASREPRWVEGLTSYPWSDLTRKAVDGRRVGQVAQEEQLRAEAALAKAAGRFNATHTKGETPNVLI